MRPSRTLVKVCPQCDTEYPDNARFCEIDGTALRQAGADAASDLTGSIVADRYHVVRKLGEGGMGQVYLAEHVKMGRNSALKVIHPRMMKDVDAISRFNREAASASRISHPNVAAIYDFGETADGIIYLAMEFVDGPSLTKLIADRGPLPPKRAAEIARQTAEALTVAHDMGIVHRDLKPDNIMIGTTRDGADLAKVVDFGIAKMADSTSQKLTKTGGVVGTPDYMSPEQLAGDPVDGRSDIYSLGLVTFSMLTGTLPFPGDSAQESMIKRLTDKPKTLSEVRPEGRWPSEIQPVLDKALERDANRRYQTAIDFARALTRAVEHAGDETAVAITRGASASVPATRIAPHVAPRLLGNEANDSAPALSSQKRRIALTSVIGGIAVLLAISAALYAPILRRNKKPPVLAADSTGTPSPSHPSHQSSTPPADSSRRAGLTLSAIDLDRELSAAEREAKGDDTAAARAAINRVVAVETSLASPVDAARAAFVKFNAYLTLDDRAKACAALVSVKGRVRGTSYQSKVDDRLETCP